MAKKIFTNSILVAFFISLSILISCGEESEDLNSGSISDNDEFHGYLSTDESQGFGDLTLTALNSVPYVDPYNFTNPSDGHTLIFLWIEWGYLDGNLNYTNWIDWSGELTISQGSSIAVTRTIVFESPDDFVYQRQDPAKVSWNSWILDHLDGIWVKLDADPNAIVQFKTNDPGLFSRTFAINELEEIREFYNTSTSGQETQIRFIATKPLDIQCGHGFLSGPWGKWDDGRQGGYFKGTWVDLNYNTVGYLKGNWIPFPNNDGGAVYGKYIDENGNFIGFISGSYWDNHDNSGGEFDLHWFNNVQDPILGIINGNWQISQNGSRGYFVGRWGKFCPNTLTAN